MITCFNLVGLGDVLLVMLNNDLSHDVVVTRTGKVAEIKNNEGVIGYNFFDMADVLGLTAETSGQLFLNAKQVEALNAELAQNNFAGRLEVDDAPKVVVGHVESCVPHPDSDHLQITQTRVAKDKVVQIVCGAPNVEAGQNVVVALPGVMMPNGSLIFPSELRGVESFGMICSARELHLPNAPQKRGILVLAPDAVVGTPFAVGK